MQNLNRFYLIRFLLECIEKAGKDSEIHMNKNILNHILETIPDHICVQDTAFYLWNNKIIITDFKNDTLRFVKDGKTTLLVTERSKIYRDIFESQKPALKENKCENCNENKKSTITKKLATSLENCNKNLKGLFK